MSDKISNVKYELVNSVQPGYKEVRVTFLFNGNRATYFIFVAESKGTDCLSEAKKIFNKDLENGKVKKAICGVNRKCVSNSAFTVTTCVLAAAVLALGGVLTWKLLTPTPGGGDTPVVDESVSTLTYSYSPYRKNNKPIIYFEIPDENEEEPPFVGDVSVQWNKDDPSTKVKVEAGTNNVTFDYKEKYPNIDPREFTIVISGDVRTFSTVSGDNIEDDGNSYFTSINIGQSVTTIMPGAFNGVNYLHSVHIAGNVNKIKSEAFCGCTNLQCVDFSTIDETDHLDIAYGCFMACDNLKTVHFPKRLTYLGPLKSCRSLEELTIPKDNEYYSSLYKNDEGETVESGMLVTKKDVKCPHFDEYIQYDDIDCKKDTVVASTIHPHIYEGIKAINSLSGADINQLVIPSTVESINAHELAISHIDSICVEQGNQHYTDLYQTITDEGEFKTANVLAELNNETSELSIIKVAKDATRIEEMGDIYINGEPKSYPVTDIAHGAINNSDVTSLDLPSTLKTFNFDTLYDTAYFYNNNQNVNPFYEDLTDLTIRAINPPTYVPNEAREPTFHISELFSKERTDRVNIHVPDSATQNYAFQFDEFGNIGYWNFNSFYSNNPDIKPEGIRFQYGVIDSQIFSSREEAKQWVAEHYKQQGGDNFFGFTKWDFTPLIDLASYGQITSGIREKLDNLNNDKGNWLPVSFDKKGAASINPNSKQPGPAPINGNLYQGNFDEFFKMLTHQDLPDSQNDFIFSVQNGCLEAIQCPSLVEFKIVGQETPATGKVKHTLKFDKDGYVTLNRLDIKDFTYSDVVLDDIYFSFENYGHIIAKEDAKAWAISHAGKTAQVNEQSLNWSFATGSDYNSYAIIEDGPLYNGIEAFIRSVVTGEMAIEDLHCEKNVPCTYSTPLDIESITESDIDSIVEPSFYCTSEDDNYLYIIEPMLDSTGTLEQSSTRVRRFNTNGICEYDAYYIFANRLKAGSLEFSGYVEITNNINDVE